MVRLLKYPHPYKAALAISNDIDWMTWRGFREFHDFVCGSGETRYGQGLGLEVANSFWIWNHRPHGELSLYVHSPFEHGARSPEHDDVLELARRGWLDTLHGFGHWKSSDTLNRDQMRGALDLLADSGITLKNYVNHGGLNMAHNLGGVWGYYQHGDEPDHQTYCLDLLLKSGFRYFWTDIMYENQKFGEDSTWKTKQVRDRQLSSYNASQFTQIRGGTPEQNMQKSCHALGVGSADELKTMVFDSLLFPVTMRDGNRVLGFKRYRGEYQPNTASFGHQVNAANLDSLVERQATCIIYQHFGVWKPLAAPNKHSSARRSAAPLLDENAVWAFGFLAERQASGEIFITTTRRLLDFVWTRKNLKFHAAREGDVLRIVLECIDCPVYGKHAVTSELAQGLSFAVDAAPENIVCTDATGLEFPIARVVDDKGGAVAMIPWVRMTYPSFGA